MTKKTCTTCKNFEVSTGGIAVCNLFTKYALIARQFLCVKYKHWEKILKSK